MVAKIIKILFVLIVIAVIVGIYFVHTFDINNYKSRIESEILKATSQSTQIDDLSLKLSLRYGLLLKVKNMKLLGEVTSELRSKVEIEEILLKVSIKEYLKTKKFLVNEVSLKNPYVELIKTAKKSISDNVAAKPLVRKKESNAEAFSLETDPDEIDLAIPEFMIEMLRVDGGTLSFSDESSSPAVNIVVDKINFETKEFSLNKEFDYVLSFSLLSEKENFAFKGGAMIDQDSKLYLLNKTKIKTNLSDLSVGKLFDSFPTLENVGIGETLYGQLIFDCEKVIFSNDGLRELNVRGEMIDGKVLFDQFEYPLENIDMSFSATENSISFDQIFLYFASGMIRATGSIDKLFEKQEFEAEISVEEVDIDEVISKQVSDIKTEGKIFGQFKGEGQGLDFESIENNFFGSGDLRVESAKLVDLNILKLIVEKLSVIPNLSEKLERNLSIKDKKRLEAKDTEFKEISFDIIAQEGFVRLRNAQIHTDDFILLAGVKCSFQGDLTVKGDLYIEKDLSIAMSETVDELGLLQESNRIHIPLKEYEGKVDNFVIYPNIEEIGKKVFRKKGKDELRKVLFDAIGYEKDDNNKAENTEKSSDTPNEPVEKKKVPPEAILIENVLDMIFK